MSRTIQVIHCAYEGLNPFDKQPQVVAIVTADHDTIEEDLEYAFRWTQNIGGCWSMEADSPLLPHNPDHNDNVEVIVPLPFDADKGHHIGLRSTSVNDIMVTDNQIWLVDRTGFKRLSFLSP